jgi:hypothetical protein
MAFLADIKPWSFLFLVIFCLVAPSWSLAQKKPGQASPAATPRSADQETVTGPPTSGPILSSGALPMGKGNFAIQPYTYLTFLGGEFSPTWKLRGAGKDLITLGNALSVYYGFTENFWVSVFWSYYIQNWAFNIQNPGQPSSAQNGDPGPLSVTFRYRFFKQQGQRPTITGLFTVGVPYNRGSQVSAGAVPAAVSTANSWGFTWGVNLHKYARPLILYLNLWYFMATIDESVEVVDGGINLNRFKPWDQIKFNLACEIPLRWKGGPWVVLLEMNSFFEVGPVFGPGPETKPAAKFTGLVGIEYIFNPQWRLALGFGFNILGKNSNFQYAPIITLYKPLNLFKRKGR